MVYHPGSKLADGDHAPHNVLIVLLCFVIRDRTSKVVSPTYPSPQGHVMRQTANDEAQVYLCLTRYALPRKG
ncbi:hypothetical protein GDO78_015359 [Eleutherodactylus coqui]|uniref:Uncharacterized protein n=1 Tax=Eleutherodactylus coqui TaxID=57060 RepID=A0A8J6JP99_ELECQ|nr:hypothetical protein GDO78_015359 [Eleutherodactylus coqui]